MVLREEIFGLEATALRDVLLNITRHGSFVNEGASSRVEVPS